ncbi:thiol:disulfide interchange protein DsbA/DsbL [Sedimenticola hydrogenitrophicus]|uniref:thiol:disulfide interchange protein DsbA/DsbL n=1 Tax=Sedimenticola hydrogenitrophicus TaxID=2967975 RepID=UPI0023B10F13|nr:thiol:disulfide interchange protein DsbA/DsbL [Sedimenticola hydrogenitrophicus]
MKKFLLASLALTLTMALLGCDDGSQIPKPEPGKQSGQATTEVDIAQDKYKLLKAPLPSAELGATEPYVVEFFWFGCPHCYSLEPLVKAFRQNNQDIQFITIPAAPNQRWEIEARIYYAMETLGIRDSHYDRVFQLYADMRNEKRYPTLDEVAALFGDKGVTKEALEQAMGSAAVSTLIERSKRLFDQAELTGVPSLIVNGKYQLDFAKLDGEAFAEDFMQTIRALGDK